MLIQEWYAAWLKVKAKKNCRAFPDGLQQTVFPRIPMGIPSAQQSRLQQTVFPVGIPGIYSLENWKIMVFSSLYIGLGNTNGNTWEYVGIRGNTCIPRAFWGKWEYMADRLGMPWVSILRVGNKNEVCEIEIKKTTPQRDRDRETTQYTNKHVRTQH